MLALVATLLLGALGAGLVSVTNTERAVAMNFRDAAETLYAAEVGAEYVLQELQASITWDDLLSGAATSTFSDGTLTPTLASNRTITLASLTADLQAESDRQGGWGANNPAWQLVAHAPLGRVTGGGPAVPGYAAVWLADDPSETDGDPRRDANGVVLLRAQAFGRGRATRSLELVVARDAASGPGRAAVRVLSWRVVR